MSSLPPSSSQGTTDLYTEQRFTESQSSALPILVRGSAFKDKTLLQPKYRRLTMRLWCFPLSLCLYSLSFSPFCRCVHVACVTERKLSSLPPPTLGIVIPLLLSSALPLNAAMQPANSRSVPQCCHIFYRGEVCECRGAEGGLEAPRDSQSFAVHKPLD